MIQNVCVDQALDAVAKTFKSIVLYKYCELPGGAHSFQINAVSEWAPASRRAPPSTILKLVQALRTEYQPPYRYVATSILAERRAAPDGLSAT